jgi:(1->4)-alpha-D-glucan 1-alpha-D-glucosylmutase
MAPQVRATYRVQLTPGFTFDDAAAIVPYLARLGVSHLYTSPLFEASPGSTHGYDVTDPQAVRAELGGPQGLRRLWEALDAHGMGQVVDIVPNHMGIRHESNRWWQDVLANGPDSAYAHHFDIDWSVDEPGFAGKVVLPFLDRPMDQAIGDRAITIDRRADTPEFVVRHHGDVWPASDASMALLGLSASDCGERLDGALDELRRDPALLASFLGAQHWRAVHWRETAARLNWRRFFDVTDLAAVAVEREDVFDDVHLLVRQWLDDDLGARVVQGLRVDHVDGLVDPAGYLERLRALIGPDRLLVVEKILAADEQLPSWPVDGTTGYEVTARINEAMTSAAGAEQLVHLFTASTTRHRSWPDVAARSRHQVARELLRPEVVRAADAFGAAVLAAGEPERTVNGSVELVRELACELDVYRTYPRPGSTELSDTDRDRVIAAAGRLAQRRPDLPARSVALATALLTRQAGQGPEADAFATRFNQLTAPLAAKAIEDTAFYRYAPCAWLDEVGGEPDRVRVATDELHAFFGRIAGEWPGTMVPLTTHDTKRGGDVRARLSRLSERPVEYGTAFTAWRAGSAGRTGTLTTETPELHWLVWQVLVGAWPLDLDRALAYATKAMREAKAGTSWIDPHEGYEAEVLDLVGHIVEDDALRRWIEEFVVTIRAPGRAASLAQLVLSATAAGAPDVYQGDELWNLVLVDPDNRAPVDYDRRRAVLEQVLHLRGEGLCELWRATRDEPSDDGVVKLAVLQRLLALRGPDGPLRADLPYTPLPVSGEDAEAVLAYSRGDDLLVVVPRRFLDPILAEVHLPGGTWVDALSGAERLGGPTAVSDLLDRLPVAILRRAT